MTAVLFSGAIALSLLLRQRLIVILGLAAALLYLLYGDGKLSYVVLDIWAAADKEVLLSVPLFLLAGNIIARGSIAERLIDVVRAGTRPLPGGLGMAAVLSCAVFSAISGSSTVTLIAVGAIMYPALLNEGYDRLFAIGLICAAATLGIIVPPSIPLILYGVITETSVADLFIAGVGPAAFLVVLLTAYTVIMNRNARTQPIDGAVLTRAVRRSGLAVFMPLVILGGIYSGYFTPTESAAVAVAYAIVVETLFHREMGLKDLEETVFQTARTLGSLVPVLMLALSINTFFAFEQLPQQLVEIMSANVNSELAFLGVSMLLLLLFGCFMDISSAILILAPLLKAIAESYDINPVQWGIIMIVNLEIGYLTPPLGLNLIIGMTAFRESFWTIAKAAVPFIGLLLIGLMVTIFWPALSLFLVG